MNCKGEKWELVQILNTGATRKYSRLIPLRMKASQEIECDCPNLYYDTANQGWIKGGYLFTTFETGKVYLNYQGAMEDDAGQLLAIGKLAQPIRKRPDVDMNFLIRIDLDKNIA
jgi:hypothetical protein